MDAATPEPPSGRRPPASLSRREVLGTAWLGAIALLIGQGLGAASRFVMPYTPGRPRGVEEPVPMGVFEPDGPLDDLVGVQAYPRAKFWWVQSEEGAQAFYTVCTHLGCIYSWKEDQNRFICPCHGQQYTREGAYIMGPAPRSLDRFVIHVYDEDDKEIARTPEDGGPVRIPAGGRVVVDVGDTILGDPRPQPERIRR